MNFKGGLKSGVAPFGIVITIIIFLVGALIAFSVFIPIIDVGGDVSCQHFCEIKRDAIGWGPISYVDPRARVQPGEMGCYCGVRENFGKFLHVNMDPSSDPSSDPSKLKAFHLTQLHPVTIGSYSVPGNTDLENNCNLDTEKWHDGIGVGDNRCYIFAVEWDSGITGGAPVVGGDDCAIYSVKEGAKIKGGTRDNGEPVTILEDIDEYLDDTNPVLSTNSVDYLNDIALGDFIKGDYDGGMEGQAYLLNRIPMERQEERFLLYDNLKCDRVGDEMVWRIGDPELELGDPDE